MNIEERQLEGNFNKIKMMTVESLTVCQSIEVLPFLDELKKEKPLLIVEIGTCSGGFTLLLRKYFPETEIQTFDIDEWGDIETKHRLFKEHNISFHMKDCFKSKLLIKLIKDKRKKIVFCDGGNKVKEVNYFSPYLNKGDIICAHDYFNKHSDRTDDIWTCCEITKEDVKNLNQVYHTFYKSVWGAFRI